MIDTMANYDVDLKDTDKRIIIVGGPRTGKSTLAHGLLDDGFKHYCGDPLSTVKEPLANVTYLPEDMDWHEGSQYVADEWFKLDGPIVLEGQIMARALRKWLRDGNQGSPVDKILVLCNHHPDAIVTVGQETMHKGVMTVWSEIASKFKDVTQFPKLAVNGKS